MTAFLKALDEKGDPCANALLILIEEILSRPSAGSGSGSDSPQLLSTLIKAFKDVSPKMKKVRSENTDAEKLPCVKAAAELWSKNSSKIEAMLSLAGSLGLAPEGLVDGIKKASKSFTKANQKDEF